MYAFYSYEIQCLWRAAYGEAQKRRELIQVDTIFTDIVVRVSVKPPRAIGGGPVTRIAWTLRLIRVAGQRPADETFKTAFGGVGVHRVSGMSS